jgi:hypothetical protein
MEERRDLVFRQVFGSKREEAKVGVLQQAFTHSFLYH